MALPEDGFAVIEGVLSDSEIHRWVRFFETVGPGRHGVRDILAHCNIAELATSDAVRGLIEPALGPNAFAVRGIFFDKLEGANWKVPWHQDVTICVNERSDLDGYRPWSTKDGIPHVQPPAEILQQMLTVRLHLDACESDNGPLRVIPGSHRFGKLSPAEVDRLAAGDQTVCTVGAGGAVLMRPLLLHASSPAERPRHRRVIHLEFAACELRKPLEWHWRVGNSNG